MQKTLYFLRLGLFKVSGNQTFTYNICSASYTLLKSLLEGLSSAKHLGSNLGKPSRCFCKLCWLSALHGFTIYELTLSEAGLSNNIQSCAICNKWKNMQAFLLNACEILLRVQILSKSSALQHMLQDKTVLHSDVFSVADCQEQWDSSFQPSKNGGRRTVTTAHQ